MISLRILVLDDYLPRRETITRELTALGVCAVFHAVSYERALGVITSVAGVDVLVCDLNSDNPEYFDFLMTAGRSRLVSALILGSVLEPPLLRAVECINRLSHVKLIGVLSAGAPVQNLGPILRDYIQHKSSSLKQARSSFRLPTEAEVRRGLEAQEFKAWFQPKFDLRTGKPYGVEALARWQHPSRGLLLPGEFLSAVLAYDLIDDMFKQVFAQGLELLASLRERKVSLQLAFNLHASQLANLDLVLFIEKALVAHGLPGSALMFELAENGLLNMPAATLNSLLCLRMLGCGLSIDDFGVGFSSLTMLCQSPFNELKLDGSVVQDFSDHRTKAMVASTIALAGALNMSLVIEGVSSQEIRDQAVAMGGTFAQGFHLAKPMSMRRLQAWLE